MTQFHDVHFPFSLSLGARGGPERRTDIITLGSGFEERNSPWAHSRRRYDAGLAMRRLEDLHDIAAFFEARRGPLFGFRFRDPVDYASVAPGKSVTPQDQVIGTGDGTTRSYQLIKTYGTGAGAYSRPITKPASGTVRLAIAGVETSLFSLDTDTGEITFDTAPLMGATITAGYRFDVPVRFDTDRLDIDLSAFEAGSAPSIPLIEIKV